MTGVPGSTLSPIPRQGRWSSIVEKAHSFCRLAKTPPLSCGHLSETLLRRGGHPKATMFPGGPWDMCSPGRSPEDTEIIITVLRPVLHFEGCGWVCFPCPHYLGGGGVYGMQLLLVKLIPEISRQPIELHRRSSQRENRSIHKKYFIFLLMLLRLTIDVSQWTPGAAIALRDKSVARRSLQTAFGPIHSPSSWSANNSAW